MVVSPSSYNVRFSAGQSNTFLKESTVATHMISPNKILAVACTTCGNGNGEIYFYDAETLDATYTLKDGFSSTQMQDIGAQITYRPNTGYSEQFWYTSRKASEVYLNSIVFFKKTG